MIIRCDDLPSGIRPIEKNLSNFFKMFDLFELNEIEFHVGIVPALLEYMTKEDKDRLKKYKYLIPCQHGYEHRYKEFSQLLIEKGDIYNQKTMGTFNEFENVTYEKQLSDIQTGNLILNVFFKKEISSYIPVCNYVDERLIKALNKLQFKNIFVVSSTKHHDTRNIKKTYTHFDGRLHQLTEPTESICLHITWENDYIREHGWDKWEEQFYKIFPRKANPKKAANKIPQIANFYWNTETPLSYLRYLTILSFKHFHPDWKINIWVSKSDTKNVWQGNTEKQDFQKKPDGHNYLLDALTLGVNILQFDDSFCQNLAPNYISDIARFKTLFDGGWFFDLDQIFTRNFDELCGNDFVTGIGYVNRINCGVLGASKESLVPKRINELQISKLNQSFTLNGYCELGNHFLHDNMWGKTFGSEKHLIAPAEVFYPISTSPEVVQLYKGRVDISALKNTYSCHWYGGHPLSQDFNSTYTEKFAKTSNDSISVYLRKIGLI